MWCSVVCCSVVIVWQVSMKSLQVNHLSQHTVYIDTSPTLAFPCPSLEYVLKRLLKPERRIGEDHISHSIP